MKHFLKFVKMACFWAWITSAVAFLFANVFVMRSEVVQQFILDFGALISFGSTFMLLAAEFLLKRYDRIVAALSNGIHTIYAIAAGGFLCMGSVLALIANEPVSQNVHNLLSASAFVGGVMIVIGSIRLIIYERSTSPRR